MTLRYHGSKISGSQQFFLKEIWPFDCRTMEERHGLSTLAPECNHAHESHSNHDSNQLRYLQQQILSLSLLGRPDTQATTTRFIEIEKFCYHGNVIHATTSLMILPEITCIF